MSKKTPLNNINLKIKPNKTAAVQEQFGGGLGMAAVVLLCAWALVAEQGCTLRLRLTDSAHGHQCMQRWWWGL